MSDAFFHKIFGDSEPTHLGSGWISGVLGVFFGLLGLGGALCLHFPALLTLPEARSHYPMVVIRLLIQGTIAAAFVLAGLSAILRQRKVLALTARLLTKWLAIPSFQAFVQRWPYLVQLVAAIFVADLGQYVVHRTFHTVPFLWRFHSIHHSIKTLDWIAGSRSHFIDIVITRGLVMIPMMVCGFPQSVLAGS